MSTATIEKVKPATPAPNGSKPRRLISKAAIKAAKPASHEDVPCDEWEPETAYRVGPMDYETHEMWEYKIFDIRDENNAIVGDTFKGLRRTIVGRCMIDEDGKRLYETDEEAADVLRSRDWRPIQRGFMAVLRLSKNLDEQVEDAVKNSDSSPSDVPSTG